MSPSFPTAVTCTYTTISRCRGTAEGDTWSTGRSHHEELRARSTHPLATIHTQQQRAAQFLVPWHTSPPAILRNGTTTQRAGPCVCLFLTPGSCGETPRRSEVSFPHDLSLSPRSALLISPFAPTPERPDSPQPDAWLNTGSVRRQTSNELHTARTLAKLWE